MADDFSSSSHPLLPPTSEDERVSWLRLLRSRRVGIATFYRLLSEYGSAEAALCALPDIAKNAVVEKYRPHAERDALFELKRGKDLGATLLCRGDKNFPKPLEALDDCPPMLWCKGNLDLLHGTKIALVGARNASSLGTRMARAMSSALGEKGVVVVSGLARGIDAAAHHAALETGTIAVLAGGIDIAYPAENAALFTQMETKGVLITEQPITQQPLARHFPARNRLISGISKALVVIEAAGKSGSLITARFALDQGRDVFAVPGHPFDARASGCNSLIRDGAILVRSAEDVLNALGVEQNSVQKDLFTHSEPQNRTLSETAKLHSEILRRLGPSPMSEDQLIRDISGNAAQTSAVVVELELEGKVLRQPGGLLSKTMAS